MTPEHQETNDFNGRPERAMLCAAVYLYLMDASAWDLTGIDDTSDRDRLGAWHDLMGPQDQLRRLCSLASLDFDYVAERMVRRIASKVPAKAVEIS